MAASLPLRSDTVLGTGRTVGFGVTTPTFPATGVAVSNPNQYSVMVLILSPGTTTSWTLTDGDGRVLAVASVLSNGFLTILPPGWSISIAYTVAPTWRWAAV